MLPLLFPFHGWRIQHDKHHKHLNKVGVDTAWSPATRQEFFNLNPIVRWAYHGMRGRLWFLASIIHWLRYHFFGSDDMSDSQKAQVSASALLVVFFSFVCLAWVVTVYGWQAFAKFWLMPWLGYHFWMSTFTLVHHTLPEVPWSHGGHYNPAHARLAGTVHCKYPRWIEVLCHDINVHVPHHLCPAIPSYNLRKAHDALRSSWGAHLVERTFSWGLLREIVNTCHIYDPTVNYRSIPELRSSLAKQTTSSHQTLLLKMALSDHDRAFAERAVQPAPQGSNTAMHGGS